MAKFIINEPKLTREEWLREKFNALRPIHTLEKFFALRFKKNKSTKEGFKFNELGELVPIAPLSD